ncbi:glycosyl transferase family 2 [Sulfuricella sp. T08]|uniref:glycosyltransferase family 2 protein n=1 Tax=Sulfuricella sp. T08 TaxID=1632857 RepID=UPI0006179977|nr:glycosyltransferase family 2 protein [Sulfuricella sp. T08]GAO34787.1 glycosyl transferase family 2 [Sulfuricella sp. T08]
MNQVEPLVSVCIPTYNRAKKLERAVQSLVKSGYKNLEIIISDNASSDETQRVCSALRASDSRVKYFRHAENQGPTENFKFAKNQATGKYFLWHGDDDYLDPDYIRTCVDELERDPSLVLVSGLAAYHGGDNALTHYGNVIQSDSDLPLMRVLKYLWLVGDNSIFCGAYRVDRVRDCRMPNCLAGDWVWMASVLLRGKAKIVPAVHVHRDFEDSTSSSIARIVSVIGAPRWHARFPWIAQSLNVANQLIFQSNEYKVASLTRKISNYMLIYGVLVVKGLIMNLRILGAKIPFVRKIYREYFKKPLVG